MSNRKFGLAPAAALLLAAGCSEQLPLPSEPAPGAVLSPTAARTADVSEPWAEVVDGEVGPGTSYRIYVPKGWQEKPQAERKLVVYAHGIVAPFLPVAQPTEGDGMAQIFGSQGFAVAMSSYKETGLAMKDGAQRTHQLSGIFASRFGKPSRTYLVGSSMGGYIVAKLAEKFPKQYDGVMPMCGVVGGFPAEFAYVLNVRTMFDALYTDAAGNGVLPGTPMAVDMPSDPKAALAMVGKIQKIAGDAFAGNPFPGFGIALSDQAPMPMLDFALGKLKPEQIGEFVVTPLVLHAIFINDIVQHTQGHFPISNEGVEYSTSSFLAPKFLKDPADFYAALNKGIERVRADRDAMNWVEHNGNTSGDISLPTLTLHTLYDTWVPVEQEAIYKAKVADAGKSHLLVQRTTNSAFGHCAFTPSEIYGGLAELVAWVEHGKKPKA
jgi:pimeloyl-ACP methyl ester carboxylesterase